MSLRSFHPRQILTITITITVTILCSLPISTNAEVQRSQLCKDVAAHKWLLDFTMAHGAVTQDQRLEAIRQVAQYTELVRNACGDNRINGEINRAARAGYWPAWIENEVSALIAKL